jgi:hypothetical protein
MRQWLVQDVMTRDVLAVTPGTPYREIVDSLVRRRVTCRRGGRPDHLFGHRKHFLGRRVCPQLTMRPTWTPGATE